MPTGRTSTRTVPRRRRARSTTRLITNDRDTTTKSTDVTYGRTITAGTDYAGEAGIFRTRCDGD
ncbi:hypothetical protein FGU65_06250 [Methanoculleus sp. FWC-SCC1]|uniref:Uncharacterized protein n=1 Tax=Methanoculleus frigidifontis TaxID=2584085 RepID=A0ABT8M993_9EURY|nr:hypothetical protein [Methanoculleus sp. FWC-SCC1]MDN7024493.1 hypothetical protein [Methanoculleus sp. FWC-SCC1]